MNPKSPQFWSSSSGGVTMRREMLAGIIFPRGWPQGMSGAKPDSGTARVGPGGERLRVAVCLSRAVWAGYGETGEKRRWWTGKEGRVIFESVAPGCCGALTSAAGAARRGSAGVLADEAVQSGLLTAAPLSGVPPGGTSVPKAPSRCRTGPALLISLRGAQCSSSFMRKYCDTGCIYYIPRRIWPRIPPFRPEPACSRVLHRNLQPSSRTPQPALGQVSGLKCAASASAESAARAAQACPPAGMKSCRITCRPHAHRIPGFVPPVVRCPHGCPSGPM
ncbi:hypothetical protein VUR80DRAFT_8600 [Thermomyces stellatus]